MNREYVAPPIRESILKRDGYRCRYCGSKESPFHLDHVYPFSRGGETSLDNLVTSCSSCNLKKYNRVGIWPKPIGYFNDVEQTNFTKSILRVSTLFITLFILSLSISDFLSGNLYYGQVELFASALVVLPIFLEKVIIEFKNFKESL